MSNNVKLEKELYPPMCEWLENFLKGNYKNDEIIVKDTSQYSLDKILEELGVIDEYPETIGIGIQIDVLGVVKTRNKSLLFFIEAKKTILNTHDLGQILIYSRICNPEKSFLFSSSSTGSLSKLLLEREDLLSYSADKKIKMIQVAKWDVVCKCPDNKTIIPRL
ncbi:TPA: hypothetical protein ACGO5P_000821 [Streptococcus suis]